MTTIRSNDGGNEDITSNDGESQTQNHKTVTQTSSGKSKKQVHDKKDKARKKQDCSLDRTASEGASGKGKVPSLTYKRAQNQEKRVSNKRSSDMYRSASYSVVGGVQKEKETKRLPAVPGRASRAGDKSEHDYDKVKGADSEKAHKYANVDLGDEASTSLGIMEPKYDEVDTESAKKGRKADKKGKPKGAKADHEHFYHTLEESQIEEGEEGTNDEEYSSPKRKALVVSKVTVHSKTGKGQVQSTEESATVKGTKTERAKSYSEKKSSKKGRKKNNHDYDEPSRNTLPHRSSDKSKNNKESSMQKGNLASVFDDPMYIASMNVSGGASSNKTTSSTPQPPPRESSPKRTSVEMPQAATSVTLRKSEQAKQPTDDPKYDEPNEKKPGALTKKEIYSSKLFDDPKYEGGFPLD